MHKICNTLFDYGIGAADRTWTCTSKTPDPKSGASANSATAAFQIQKNGDPPGTRTRDTLIKSQVLYQLSYGHKYSICLLQLKYCNRYGRKSQAFCRIFSQKICRRAAGAGTWSINALQNRINILKNDKNILQNDAIYAMITASDIP